MRIVLAYWVWLTMLPKLSKKQKIALLEAYSDPEDIYNESVYDHLPFLSTETVEQLQNKDLRAARQVVKTCAEKQISMITIRDAAYPRRLRGTEDAPILLFYKGVLPDFDDRPTIGVVGTRKATGYGTTNAYRIAGQIAACGGVVVSGGAFGIDTAALKGALDAGCQVAAVLGCGVDVVYPRANKDLFQRIVRQGCLISEYLPGTEPYNWYFLERNRIISGMSNGVLVVEAPERSGALNTAKHAFSQGRDVFAVPGNIDVPNCSGSNALLHDFARAAMNGWDVMCEYADTYGETVQQRQFTPLPEVVQAPADHRTPPAADKKGIDNPSINAYSDVENTDLQLTDQERKLLSLIGGEPTPVDELITQADMDAAVVLRIITKLSMRNVVILHPGKLVSVKNN